MSITARSRRVEKSYPRAKCTGTGYSSAHCAHQSRSTHARTQRVLLANVGAALGRLVRDEAPGEAPGAVRADGAARGRVVEAHVWLRPPGLLLPTRSRAAEPLLHGPRHPDRAHVVQLAATSAVRSEERFDERATARAAERPARRGDGRNLKLSWRYPNGLNFFASATHEHAWSVTCSVATTPGCTAWRIR